MKYIDYYNTHKDKIFSYFYYNLNQDISTSEDLTSDTFMKAFEKFESYDGKHQFSTWIFTIARNTLYDHYRKNKINVQMDDDSEMTLKEFIIYEQDFNKKIDIKIQMDSIYPLLDRIPEMQKEIIIMKYLKEFSNQEISEVTGKNEASIRKILSRWLKSLLDMLQPLSS